MSISSSSYRSGSGTCLLTDNPRLPSACTMHASYADSSIPGPTRVCTLRQASTISRATASMSMTGSAPYSDSHVTDMTPTQLTRMAKLLFSEDSLRVLRGEAFDCRENSFVSFVVKALAVDRFLKVFLCVLRG